MKTKDILITALCTAAAILSASCSSDELMNSDNGSPKAAIVTASLPQTNVTRATGNVWTDHYQSIGVRVTAEQNNANCASSCSMANDYKNMKYNVSASNEDGTTATFSAESDDICFKEEGEHLFSAYAPYSSTLTNDATIAVNTLTGNASQTAQKAIDYIYAEGAKASSVSPQVAFAGENEFVHKLSKLNLTIKMGEGFSASDISNISSIILGGLKHVGTFDITTGEAATSSDATVDLTLSPNATDNILTSDASAGTLKLSLYLLPQDCSSSALPLTIAYDDVNFSNKTSITPNLIAGKACNYEITMNKTGITVSNGMLTDWDPADMTGMPGEIGMAAVESTDLTGVTGTYTANDEDILTGTTSAKIIIPAGASVTLKNLEVNNRIACNGDANIYIKGKNKVTTTFIDIAGINVGPRGTTLTIDGDADGIIEVNGGSSGAGIGSGSSCSSCGNITINGGTIIANSQYGAGIGSGYSCCSCGNITINGGTIIANSQYGAGIGSGQEASSCGNITINGGTITATGSLSGAAIGCGYYMSSCGAITISGVNDMRVNSGANNSSCIGKGSESGDVGDIKVTDSSITMDNSGGTNAPYFNPTPTFVGTVVIKDPSGNDITDQISHN